MHYLPYRQALPSRTTMKTPRYWTDHYATEQIKTRAIWINQNSPRSFSWKTN